MVINWLKLNRNALGRFCIEALGVPSFQRSAGDQSSRSSGMEAWAVSIQTALLSPRVPSLYFPVMLVLSHRMLHFHLISQTNTFYINRNQRLQKEDIPPALCNKLPAPWRRFSCWSPVLGLAASHQREQLHGGGSQGTPLLPPATRARGCCLLCVILSFTRRAWLPGRFQHGL